MTRWRSATSIFLNFIQQMICATQISEDKRKKSNDKKPDCSHPCPTATSYALYKVIYLSLESLRDLIALFVCSKIYDFSCINVNRHTVVWDILTNPGSWPVKHINISSVPPAVPPYASGSGDNAWTPQSWSHRKYITFARPRRSDRQTPCHCLRPPPASWNICFVIWARWQFINMWMSVLWHFQMG